MAEVALSPVPAFTKRLTGSRQDSTLSTRCSAEHSLYSQDLENAPSLGSMLSASSLALCEVLLPFECNVHFESFNPPFILIALFPPVQ